MYSIRLANESDHENWQTCLRNSKEKHHSFDWRWRDIIQTVFRHEPIYLLAEDKEKKTVAILPLFNVKSLLFGTSLISLPYLNGGGIAFENNTQDREKILSLFLEKIVSVSQEKSARYTEIRSRVSLDDYPPVGILKKRTHKAGMSRMLAQDPETLFSSFPPKLRSQIRKPTKEGCSVVSEKGSIARNQLINNFYEVFSTNMRDLGIPVFPKELFTECLKKFGNESRVTVVFHRNQPVAAGITIGTTETVEVPFASSLKKHKKIAPNMLLYWEMMKQSILDGYLRFDFGRSSKDSGTYKFKEQWGATPEQLHWYYHISHGEIPEVSSDNKNMSLLVNMWKIMPLPLSKIIGKYITRSLP
jgi:serine/alanine adding enzyme